MFLVALVSCIVYLYPDYHKTDHRYEYSLHFLWPNDELLLQWLQGLINLFLFLSLFLIPLNSDLYCSAKHSENTPNRQHGHTSQVNLTNGTEKLTEKKEVLRPTVTSNVLSWFLFTHHAWNLTCFPAAYWRDSVCESAGCQCVSRAKSLISHQMWIVEKVTKCSFWKYNNMDN